MSGVKGRSGGKRVGAGRKAKAAVRIALPAAQKPIVAVQSHAGDDVLDALKLIALGQLDANAVQVAAAKGYLSFVRARPGDAGKKEQRQSAAKSVVAGRFAPSAPPKLKIAK